MTFQHAGQAGLAARLFGRGSPHALLLMRAAWPRAVGPDLSRRTEILALDGATLRVRVPDARWRRVLHRMQPDILARLREVAGSLAPRRLGFVEGGIADTPAPPVADPSRPPAECPPGLAREAEAIEDSELRARFMATAARYLERTRGRSER